MMITVRKLLDFPCVAKGNLIYRLWTILLVAALVKVATK